MKVKKLQDCVFQNLGKCESKKLRRIVCQNLEKYKLFLKSTKSYQLENYLKLKKTALLKK